MWPTGEASTDDISVGARALVVINGGRTIRRECADNEYADDERYLKLIGSFFQSNISYRS